MLNLPGVVVAEAICEFELIERVLMKLEFGVCLPWPGDLQFVENAKTSLGRPLQHL